MTQLAVVIPTHERPTQLARTLAALAAQTDGNLETIVVHDRPRDGAVVASEHAAVRHLRSGGQGASAARNTGWRSTSAPVVLFIGDDILADPELVARHRSFHARHPEPEAALLGRVRWADELPATPFMHWLAAGVQSDYGRLDAGGEPSWGDFLTTNVSVKRELLDRVGGFDEENFPFLYEDVDLGLRLFGAGLKLRYDPAASAQHLHPPTLEQWRERMAAVAVAERRWTDLGREPYFEPRMRAAAAAPPARGRLALALLPLAWMPMVGPRIRGRVDLHFRQQLAPSFLNAWDSAGLA